MTEGALYIIVFLLEALWHYIRWIEVLMGRKLPRTVAYILGVLGMMVPFTVWLLEVDRERLAIAFVLWKTIFSGGLSVLICYGFDAVIDLIWAVKHGREHEQVLAAQGKVHDKG